MSKKRSKRIIFEVNDYFWDLIHEEAKLQNITVKKLIYRIFIKDLIKRKEVRN
jgi:hypothetical protein